MPCVDNTAELKRAVDEVPSMHFPLTPFQHMADVLYNQLPVYTGEQLWLSAKQPFEFRPPSR